MRSYAVAAASKKKKQIGLCLEKVFLWSSGEKASVISWLVPLQLRERFVASASGSPLFCPVQLFQAWSLPVGCYSWR